MTRPIQVIVTGDRSYDSWSKVQEVLGLLNIQTIIQGGAKDADRLARAYSRLHSIESITIEADWDKFGKAAGPIRNKQMLDLYPKAVVVAFPGGAGTANCVKQAVELLRLVVVVK